MECLHCKYYLTYYQIDLFQDVTKHLPNNERRPTNPPSPIFTCVFLLLLKHKKKKACNQFQLSQIYTKFQKLTPF